MFEKVYWFLDTFLSYFCFVFLFFYLADSRLHAPVMITSRWEYQMPDIFCTNLVGVGEKVPNYCLGTVKPQCWRSYKSRHPFLHTHIFQIKFVCLQTTVFQVKYITKSTTYRFLLCLTFEAQTFFFKVRNRMDRFWFNCFIYWIANTLTIFNLFQSVK